MPKQIRIRRMRKLDFCQETKRAVKVLPKKLALRRTHVQKLHPSNFPFIATESTGTALKVSWTSGAHTPHFKRPLTRFLHCKQTSAVCNHMLFASTKVSLLNPAWEQLTFQTKAHEPFLSREPHFLLELNQVYVHERLVSTSDATRVHTCDSKSTAKQNGGRGEKKKRNEGGKVYDVNGMCPSLGRE